MTWAELFPYGRDVYYEGKDPKGFAKEMKEKFGINPHTSGYYTKKQGYRFHIPARHLDAIYGNSKYPLGS